MARDDWYDTRRGTAEGPFILEAELAARWRVSVRTLQRWRRKGMALDHFVIGQRILYRRADVVAFEASALRPGRARP